MQLFRDRAASVAPDFDVTRENAAEVAHICRRLDGMPLAIELAAAWVPFISITEILAQLDESLSLLRARSPEQEQRHRTMQATLAWSYRLLSPDEARRIRAAVRVRERLHARRCRRVAR